MRGILGKSHDKKPRGFSSNYTTLCVEKHESTNGTISRAHSVER